MPQVKKTTTRKRVVTPKKEKLQPKPVEKLAASKGGEPRPEEGREHYFEAVGRRKTSSARVRISIKGDKEILVNSKSYQNYFTTLEMREIILSPLRLLNYLDKFRIIVKVNGGGMHSQAEAVRHGLARALILFNADFRKRLKKAGYLTRDPRMREKEIRLKESQKSSSVAKTVTISGGPTSTQI